MGSTFSRKAAPGKAHLVHVDDRQGDEALEKEWHSPGSQSTGVPEDETDEVLRSHAWETSPGNSEHWSPGSTGQGRTDLMASPGLELKGAAAALMLSDGNDVVEPAREMEWWTQRDATLRWLRVRRIFVWMLGATVVTGAVALGAMWMGSMWPGLLPVQTPGLPCKPTLPFLWGTYTSTTTTTATETTTTSTTIQTTSTTTTLPLHGPTGQMLSFYTYRAVSHHEEAMHWPMGNTNTANMEGLMWYLTNEVVTRYTAGTRCPRKFHISKIKRYKIWMKTTPELVAQRMNFGARFAYDFGNCSGRCFGGNLCTSRADCDHQFFKYGYVPGCNVFRDKWPFPDMDTPAPNGIWYSFPVEGKCPHPDGGHECTWTFEYAGELPLQTLERAVGGNGNCCHGFCSGFWDSIQDPGKTSWRAQLAMDKFKEMYPQFPRDLPPPPCDFNRWAWYSPDTWPRRDPYR